MGRHYFCKNIVLQFVYIFIFLLLNLVQVTIAMSIRDTSPVSINQSVIFGQSAKDSLSVVSKFAKKYEHVDDSLQQIKDNLLRELGLDVIPDITKVRINHFIS